MDILLLLIMLLDVTLRVVAFSWVYFKNAWNSFDALVLVVSIVLGLVEAYYSSVRPVAAALQRFLIFLSLCTSATLAVVLMFSPLTHPTTAGSTAHHEASHYSSSVSRGGCHSTLEALGDHIQAIKGMQHPLLCPLLCHGWLAASPSPCTLTPP